MTSMPKTKEFASKRRKVAPSEIQVGDTVIYEQKKKNKFATKLEPTPYKVLERREVTIVAENQRHKVTRNLSFFKKISDVVKESLVFLVSILQLYVVSNLFRLFCCVMCTELRVFQAKYCIFIIAVGYLLSISRLPKLQHNDYSYKVMMTKKH